MKFLALKLNKWKLLGDAKSREPCSPLNYKNWDIVKGLNHGFITILCNVLRSEVMYSFMMGLSFDGVDFSGFGVRMIETLAVHSSG